jgi:sugar-specific transcriptional regulator TrmB
MDYRELVNLGLSEKEAKVYLAALELGKSAVQKIAQKAEVNRATTYVILESLMKKGLVSSYMDGKKQYFVAEAPEKLSILFREQEIVLQRKLSHLEKLLPELKSLEISKNDNRPTVRYFEGKDGLRAMAEELYITKNEDEARMLYSYDLLSEIFSKEEILSMRKRRQNKKIKVNSIINDELKRLESDSTRFIIPSKKYPITSDIALFGNKVRIATQKGNLAGLIIENKEISDTFKILFDLAWEYLKIINKKRGSK